MHNGTPRRPVVIAQAERPIDRLTNCPMTRLLLSGLACGQSSQQTLRRILDQIEDMLKAVPSAVIRIEHLALGMITGIRHVRFDPVAVSGSISTPSSCRLPLKCAQDMPIHRQNQIEVLEIGVDDLSRPDARQVVPTPPGRRLRPRIRRLADVICPDAGRVDGQSLAQSRTLDQSAKYPLGRRRTADIPHANE